MTTQTMCPKCNDTGVWPMLPVEYCNCEIGVAKRAESDRRNQLERLVRAWDACQVPRRFTGLTLGGHPDGPAAREAAVWADGTRETNLLITGGVGTGKTGLASAVVRHLVLKHVSGIRFVSVPAMLDAMRPGGVDDPTLMTSLVGTNLLVLDDLGAERVTDWVRERLYVLLNGRYEAMQSTIVTSNCDVHTLASAIDERTISRLTEQRTHIVLTGGGR